MQLLLAIFFKQCKDSCLRWGLKRFSNVSRMGIDLSLILCSTETCLREHFTCLEKHESMLLFSLWSNGSKWPFIGFSSWNKYVKCVCSNRRVKVQITSCLCLWPNPNWYLQPIRYPMYTKYVPLEASSFNRQIAWSWNWHFL